MSNYEKKFPDRKPFDLRVVKTIKGPVGTMLGLKTKSIWTFLVCCIEGCSNATKTKGAALCPEHKLIIRRAQYGVASTKYRDSDKNKPKPRLLSRMKKGIPSYRALLNPKEAMRLMNTKSAHVELPTEAERAAFRKALTNTQQLVNSLKSAKEAVKRAGKREAMKVENAKNAARNRKNRAAKKAQAA
jgi:hypothetical protein